MVEKMVREIGRHGHSDRQVEQALGWHGGRIYKWNKGQGEPTGYQIWQFARHYDIAVEYFLDDAISEPSPARAGEAKALITLAESIPGGIGEAIRRIALWRDEPQDGRSVGKTTVIDGRPSGARKQA